jgi:hypothetical protein
LLELVGPAAGSWAYNTAFSAQEATAATMEFASKNWAQIGAIGAGFIAHKLDVDEDLDKFIGGIIQSNEGGTLGDFSEPFELGEDMFQLGAQAGIGLDNLRPNINSMPAQ